MVQDDAIRNPDGSINYVPTRVPTPQDYNGHVPTDAEDAPALVDDKGRMLVNIMSERMLIEETVTTLRQITDGIEHLSETAKNNPMMKGLLGL